MNRIKTIGKDVLTVCTFLGAIGQIVSVIDYGNSLVRKYRKPKEVKGFASTTESSTVEE